MDRIHWVEYNSNPNQHDIDDCVIRAISLATDKDYYVAYQELVNQSISNRNGLLFNYEDNFADYLDTLGEEVEVPKIEGRKTRVKDLLNMVDNDSVLVVLTRLSTKSTHLTCVIGYNLYDTWDYSDKVILRIWKIK